MIRLKQPAAAVHRRLLQLSDAGHLVRNALDGAETPDDVQVAGVQASSWFKEAGTAAPAMFQDGSHLLRLRQEFARRDRVELLGALSDAIESLRKLERSGRYDKRELEEGARNVRSQAVHQLDALLGLLRELVGEVERVLPQGSVAAQPRIFFSWQSDSANATNRGFIERALELAIKELAAELSVDAAPRLDDAATDLTGAEDIAATILRKIDEASIFVGDVSIIGFATPRRPTPNPNVLVELGYALKTLGPGRVILMFNEASGRIEDLPFDIRPRLTMKYRAVELEPGAKDESRAPARRQLAKQLASALKGILERHQTIESSDREEPPAPLPLDVALEGVATSAPDARARIADYMAWLSRQIAERIPAGESKHNDDALVLEIDEATALVTDFARLSQAIARHDAAAAAVAVARGFEGILQLYDQLPTKAGSFRDTDFDLAKVLGHELFVVLVSALLKNESFETIAQVLDVDLCVETRQGKSARSWVDLCKLAKLLSMRKQRLNSNLYSLHAERLKVRRENPVVAEFSSFEQFKEADYFLYLAAALHPVAKPFGTQGGRWKPWSLAYMSWAEADFLTRAQRRGFATKLLQPFKLTSVEELRDRYRERGLDFARIFDQWGVSVEGGMDSDLIASRP